MSLSTTKQSELQNILTYKNTHTNTYTLTATNSIDIVIIDSNIYYFSNVVVYIMNLHLQQIVYNNATFDTMLYFFKRTNIYTQILTYAHRHTYLLKQIVEK